MIVEDNTQLLDLLSEFLKSAGYSVQAVTDGAQALDILSNQGSAVDLLISDLDLPNVDGIALATCVKNRNLQCPVILMSGKHDQLPFLPSISPAAFLRKPFSSSTLLSVVKEVLKVTNGIQDPV